jgi:hypothetical protein
VNLASIVFQSGPEEVFAFEVGSGGQWFREMKDSVALSKRKDSRAAEFLKPIPGKLSDITRSA